MEADETFVDPRARRETLVVTQKNLGAALAGGVSPEAVANPDERSSYKHPLQPRKAYQTVNHSRGEYQRQNPDGSRASMNTAKSVYSLFKRALIGDWHHISREHSPCYANELEFRWNTRHDTDSQRLEKSDR